MSTKTLILVLSASAILFGCGRHYAGVYQGKEQLNTGPGSTPQTSAMTLTLNQDSGDTVTGTWQSAQGGAGTMNAKATGDGLSSVQLVMANGGMSSSYYNYWNTAGCQQTFTGTLSAQNSNQLTGTLVGTGGCYTGYSASRTIDVSK